MKIQTVELDSRSHERFIFKMNRNELRILLALLGNSLRHTPHDETTVQFRHCCQTMTKAISHAMKLSAGTEGQP